VPKYSVFQLPLALIVIVRSVLRGPISLGMICHVIKWNLDADKSDADES